MSIFSLLGSAASKIGSFLVSNAKPIISASGGILGGLLGNRTSLSSSLDLAEQQFNYNSYLMKHRHQFEVADLRSSGLNPILSAGGSGASGSTGSGGSINSADFGSILTSAFELDNELKNSEAQRKLLKAQRDQVLSDSMKTKVSTAIDAERLKQEQLKTAYISKDPYYFTPNQNFWSSLRAAPHGLDYSKKPSSEFMKSIQDSIVRAIKSAWDWNKKYSPTYNFYHYYKDNSYSNKSWDGFIKHWSERR